MTGHGVVALGAVAIGVVLTGCGGPTAQIVGPEESRISFELPVEYTNISTTDDGNSMVYGLPDTTLDALSSDPVFSVTAVSGGSSASFQALRQFATGGQYDPLDPDLEELPGNGQVLAYDEITTPDVWGIRLRIDLGTGTFDVQALVDRQSDRVTMSQLSCTKACFAEQVDLIEQIQQSWTLGAST